MGQQFADKGVGDSFLVLETESPGIDQWSNGDVECSGGFSGYCACKVEDLGEMTIDGHVLIVVDGCDDGCLVERREGLVN